ncbi:hypothetical protein FACS1894137_08500 [Spirochaetia bacterium]|nr:hypothetical protein FACS1894137_08500 [Spirochaetia bacterium]
MKRLVELNVKKISYTGGEPTLYSQISTVVKAVADYGIEQIVTTNGDALYSGLPDWINYLQYIKLSFYGYNETHNKIMGNNSYQKLLSTSSNLRKNKICTGANFIVSSKSINDISKFLNEAQKYEFKQILMIPYINNDNAKANANMQLKDIDNCISIISEQSAKYADSFEGGIKIHIYNDNDFSLFLNSNDCFFLPRNTVKRPFVLGGLFDDKLVLPTGKTMCTADVVEYFFQLRLSTENIITIG